MEQGMYDVAIVGGGPGGSTLGALLRKHNPELRVVILEKEEFPRDHVGESLLPPISPILDEMGCWDEIEAAGFPVKIGATYTWGATRDPWVFEFLPVSQIQESPRPNRFESWRRQTAFQVDRSIFDKVLIECAVGHGCEARQGVRVRSIDREGDRITGLELETGERVTARYYVDASGNAAIIRKAMDVQVEAPTLLRNVAFWDYWERDSWPDVSEHGLTRVNIRSLPYGWLWMIVIGKTRASVGLVCPASHYKTCGKTPEELYLDAVRSEETLQGHFEGAERRGQVESTTDWSFVADRTLGENWFLVGECAGFADPILAAGLTLTMSGARELAYTILELERGEHDRKWLLERYNELQIRRVRQHMRFADYWYSANGCFSDIQENCSAIAEEAGLKLSPQEAFRWLSWGGLSDDIPGQVGVGGLDVAGVKQVMKRLTGVDAETESRSRSDWTINGKNVFKLNLANAKEVGVGRLEGGRIERAQCWVRGGRRLPAVGVQALVIEALKKTSDISKIFEILQESFSLTYQPEHVAVGMNQALQALEVMANDYWVICSVRKGRKTLDISTPYEGERIHSMEIGGSGAGG